VRSRPYLDAQGSVVVLIRCALSPYNSTRLAWRFAPPQKDCSCDNFASTRIFVGEKPNLEAGATVGPKTVRLYGVI